VRVRTLHANIIGTLCGLCHWVLVPIGNTFTAFAARGCACIATAGASLAATKLIADGICATWAILDGADISTTLEALATGEKIASTICAHLNALALNQFLDVRRNLALDALQRHGSRVHFQER